MQLIQEILRRKFKTPFKGSLTNFKNSLKTTMFGDALYQVERHKFKINLPAHTNPLVHHSGRKG